MKVFQKELVLLPFPFSNMEGTKVRPALIVSNDYFNKKGDDCLMVPLTTVIKDEPFSILLQQENLSSGKLLKPSRIRLDKIFSVEKNLISMKIGIVNDKIFQKIRQEITEMF
jgi:mRNA interferase MazF